MNIKLNCRPEILLNVDNVSYFKGKILNFFFVLPQFYLDSEYLRSRERIF